MEHIDKLEAGRQGPLSVLVPLCGDAMEMKW